MKLDDIFDDIQPETASARFFRYVIGSAKEFLEYAFLIIRRDSRSLVLNMDQNPVGEVLAADGDRAAGSRIADGVG